MLELLLVGLYSLYALTAKILIIRKKKVGFLVGITASLLQVLHVCINFTMVGILIMAFGFMAINIYGLTHWKDEVWFREKQDV